MKTTIDIPKSLLEEAKKIAQKQNTTLKKLTETALRNLIDQVNRPRENFILSDMSVKGNGLQPGFREGDWNTFRDMIYG